MVTLFIDASKNPWSQSSLYFYTSPLQCEEPVFPKHFFTEKENF